MSNMTLMFWINTLNADKMTVLSYAVNENAKEFELMVEREMITLYVQQSEKYEMYLFRWIEKFVCQKQHGRGIKLFQQQLSDLWVKVTRLITNFA